MRVALVVVLVACSACSHRTTTRRNAVSTFPSTAPVQPQTPPPPPLAAITTTDPNDLALLLAAAAAAPPAWIGPPSPHPDEAEDGMRRAAPPGMTAAPQIARATLSEGQHAEMTAQLDEGKCYAVVAFGEGLADLEVSLLTPPFFNLVAGQDSTVGPTAVVTNICPIASNAGTYRIDFFAKKGSGPVAAQLYSRPR